MRTLLVTGFEPFGGMPVNPSEAVAARVHAPDGFRLRRAILPVDTQIAPMYLVELLADVKPAAVVLLGVAARREELCVEEIARNLLDFRVPDEAGHQPQRAPIVEGGPEHLAGRLPVSAILARWTREGIAGRASQDAGEFLCNQVFYRALHALPAAIPCGFIHLPPCERLARWAGESRVKIASPMPLAIQVQGVQQVLEAVAERAMEPPAEALA